ALNLFFVGMNRIMTYLRQGLWLGLVLGVGLLVPRPAWGNSVQNHNKQIGSLNRQLDQLASQYRYLNGQKTGAAQEKDAAKGQVRQLNLQSDMLFLQASAMISRYNALIEKDSKESVLPSDFRTLTEEEKGPIEAELKSGKTFSQLEKKTQ